MSFPHNLEFQTKNGCRSKNRIEIESILWLFNIIYRNDITDTIIIDNQ